MNTVNSDMFKEVSDLKEIDKIFQDTSLHKTIITAKGNGDELYHFKVDRLSPKHGVLCKIIKTNFLPKDAQSMLCSFEVLGEKYFFQSTLSKQDIENYSIPLPKSIYQLQRRQTFRIKIPPSYKGTAVIQKVNDTVTKINSKILDISSGGCKLLYNNQIFSIKEADTVECQINIGTRDPLFFKAKVKYHKPEGNKNESGIGIEFENLKPADEQKLVSVTMDLYREFFATLRKN